MKFVGCAEERGAIVSPPVRGAWVEMMAMPKHASIRCCRPLCGGRGLKFRDRHFPGGTAQVAPCAGGVG